MARIRPTVGAAAAAIVAAVLTATVLGPAQAAGDSYYWKWSDGSRQTSRTFTQSRWGIQERLPRIVVTAQPAAPSRTVLLQSNRGGGWTTEASARTDRGGVATIEIDPYCAGGNWCRDTFRYRLSVDGQSAPLTLTFAWA